MSSVRQGNKQVMVVSNLRKNTMVWAHPRTFVGEGDVPIFLKVTLHAVLDNKHIFEGTYQYTPPTSHKNTNPLWPSNNADTNFSTTSGVGDIILLNVNPNNPHDQYFMVTLNASNIQQIYKKKHKNWDQQIWNMNVPIKVSAINNDNAYESPNNLQPTITAFEMHVERTNIPDTLVARHYALPWNVNPNSGAKLSIVDHSGPYVPNPFDPSEPLPLKWVGIAMLGVGIGLFAWGVIKKDKSRAFKVMSVVGGATAVGGGGVLAYSQLMTPNDNTK